MNELIDIKNYPVSKVLPMLLQDKTTKKNIIWATDSYFEDSRPIDPKRQITVGSLLGFEAQEIQPRVYKSVATKSDRTKAKAEVFTPCWIVNKMNNHCDEEWFEYPDVFNTESGFSWKVRRGKIRFPKDKDWKEYVDSTRLEITCGEAPYLVSRYDTTTGEAIPISRRIGILDRKLRVIKENTTDEETWLKWALRAFQATYGYEYQGDNLLIARINLLMTFVEYMNACWNHNPTDLDLRKVANIIAWNIWQMDGLTGTIPLGKPVIEQEQISFDLFGELSVNEETEHAEPCRIFDWKAKKSVTYNSLKGVR